jgi:hypothetical protein
VHNQAIGNFGVALIDSNYGFTGTYFFLPFHKSSATCHHVALVKWKIYPRVLPCNGASGVLHQIIYSIVYPHSLHFGSITSELISYSVDDDDLAPKESVDWLTNAYKNAKVKRVYLRASDIGVSRLGHFGFFNVQNKESLWRDLLNNAFKKNESSCL